MSIITKEPNKNILYRLYKTKGYNKKDAFKRSNNRFMGQQISSENKKETQIFLNH